MEFLDFARKLGFYSSVGAGRQRKAERIMVDGHTLKETIAMEKEKWSRMDAKQRWNYFKSYYLIATIAIVVVIAMLISLINTVHKSSREVLLGGILINTEAVEELSEFLTTDYVAYVGGDTQKQQAEVSLHNYLNQQDDLTSASNRMNIMVRIAAREFDYMILDESALREYEEQSVFADLRLVLLPEQLEEYKERLVELHFYEKQEDGTPIQKGDATYVGAIDITGTEFAQKYQLTSDPVYLVAVINGKHQDDFPTLVKYLL